MRSLKETELHDVEGGGLLKLIGKLLSVFTSAYQANRARETYAQWGQNASQLYWDVMYPYDPNCNYPGGYGPGGDNVCVQVMDYVNGDAYDL